MKTWDYLERLRALHGNCSDYRLAQLLNIAQQAMSKYRQGREMDDAVAVRVAALLDLPAAQVVAHVNAARAEASGESDVVAVWKQIAEAFTVQVKPAIQQVGAVAKRGARGMAKVASIAALAMASVLSHIPRAEAYESPALTIELKARTAGAQYKCRQFSGHVIYPTSY